MKNEIYIGRLVHTQSAPEINQLFDEKYGWDYGGSHILKYVTEKYFPQKNILYGMKKLCHVCMIVKIFKLSARIQMLWSY